MNETLEKLFDVAVEFGKKTVAETGGVWHKLELLDDNDVISNNLLGILEKEEGFSTELVGVGTIKVVKSEKSGLYRIDIKTDGYYEIFKDEPHSVVVYVLK